VLLGHGAQNKVPGMFSIKGQRSRSHGHRSRSQRKVMYQQQNAIRL